MVLLCVICVATAAASTERGKKRRPRKKAARPAVVFDTAIANNAAFTGVIGKDAKGSAVLRAQVLLDRAGFSVGEIDGTMGANTRKAVAAFQAARGVASGNGGSGDVDEATWKALNTDTSPALVTYTISAEDVAGLFEPVPVDMMEKANLKKLGYQSPLEGIAEKFHISPKLLTALNPDKRFTSDGAEIVVPNVAETPPLPKAASVVVDKSDRSVTALDAEGRVLAYYPATIGSAHDPLPIGKWKIVAVRRNPIFYYNPELFWDADPSHAKATLRAGPNNPVGVVWLSLSKQHYGIHGTPEPSTIGRSQSHGCIRLTNWDISELAEMVAAGTPATLKE